MVDGYSVRVIRPLMVAFLSVVVLGQVVAQNVPLDPTKPLTEAPSAAMKAEKNWVLQGIFKHEGFYTAVINGVRVREGSGLSGARVQSIKKNRVVLLQGEETVELSLNRKIMTATLKERP